MLRTSRMNPKLSSSTHIDDQYDHNRSHIAPPETIIIAHKTPNSRRTWAPHGKDGWYIGPALENYRYDWVIQYGPLQLLIKCELATYY
jgi:hypothetical protein